jgi:hypothetical protein
MLESCFSVARYFSTHRSLTNAHHDLNVLLYAAAAAAVISLTSYTRSYVCDNEYYYSILYTMPCYILYTSNMMAGGASKQCAELIALFSIFLFSIFQEHAPQPHTTHTTHQPHQILWAIPASQPPAQSDYR